MNLTLLRDVQSPSLTYGVLSVDTLTLQTIERPWLPDPLHKGGQNGVSCVPLGTYNLVLHDSELHPQTWALVNPDLGVWHLPTDIPKDSAGRSAVLIHPANFVHELLGCIAPGMMRGFSGGLAMVAQSRIAFSQLKATVPWTTGHTLTIGVAS